MFLLLTTACGADWSATDDPAGDVTPTISPTQPAPTATSIGCNALTVVYAREDANAVGNGNAGENGTVYLWKEGGSAEQLSSAGGVSKVRISLNCRWVAYLQNNELMLAPTDRNTAPKPLVTNFFLDSLAMGGGRIVRFDFSPDSQAIYFTTYIDGDNGGLDLFKIDMNVQMPVRFVGPGLGGNYTISPDSKCLTISRPNQLDVYCDGYRQPQRVFDLADECGFGADEGPDVQWKGDSSGFYVVTPKCDNNTLYGHLILWDVSLAAMAANKPPQNRAEFVGWTYDMVVIAPNGNCLAHMMDNGDLRDLHLVCTDNSDVIYASYPKDAFEFQNWSPDSKYFVFLMNPDSKRNGSIASPYYADRIEMPKPLLSEQSSGINWMAAPVTRISWVGSNRILFISKGLWVETLGGAISPIDNNASSLFDDYAFAYPK